MLYHITCLRYLRLHQAPLWLEMLIHVSQAETGLSSSHVVSTSLFSAVYSSFLISASRSLGAVVEGYLCVLHRSSRFWQ